MGGYQCTCASGFSGKTCSESMGSGSGSSGNADACFSSPCLNGGQCTNNGNSYQCACPPAFSGNNCDKVNSGGIV